MVEIAFATIDNGCYDEYLGKCGLDVMVFKPDRPPAAIYNDVLDSTRERFVCFVHADITCSGLYTSIERTIIDRPGHIVGMVGVSDLQYVWSRAEKLYSLITCDSCCVMIDKEMGLRFDDKTFDEYHLYVEDICMQAGKVSTIYINAFDGINMPPVTITGDYIIHHSHTYRRLGPMWGNYREYRARLDAKWPGVQTT